MSRSLIKDITLVSQQIKGKLIFWLTRQGTPVQGVPATLPMAAGIGSSWIWINRRGCALCTIPAM